MTIAGTDSGGGAGVVADLRAMAACGAHGCVAVTAVTVQNTLGVTGVHTIPPEVVAAQIESVAGDIALGAVKTGMLADTPIIEAIVDACDRVGIGGDGVPLVIDPVAARSSPTRPSTPTAPCSSPAPCWPRPTSTRCACSPASTCTTARPSTRRPR
jgi:hydroxymethylpyrimidine/phosphomethylpyrimidine kinase